VVVPHEVYTERLKTNQRHPQRVDQLAKVTASPND
jgi:hypothetical protein